MPTSGFQVSRARVAPVMVKVESSYGVDAAPTPGADDLLTFNSSIDVSPTAAVSISISFPFSRDRDKDDTEGLGTLANLTSHHKGV